MIMSIKIFKIGMGIVLATIFLTATAQEKYVANIQKSTLNWLGEKVTGEHHGTINLKSGNLVVKDNKIISGEFVIDMASIICLDLTDPEWNQKLVGHLKSDDFFGVTKYPEAKLVIKESTVFEKGSAIVKADLIIKGIKNPIEFKASKDIKGNDVNYFANIIVDRSKYDVRYGSGSFFDNLGDKTIYDEFKLKIALVVSK